MEQQYKKGDRIRICRVGWPIWSGGQVYDSQPEKIGQLATVEYSYLEEYGGDPEQKPSYSLLFDGEGSSAWYHEYQMEHENTEAPCIETTPSVVESEFHKQLSESYKKYMIEALAKDIEEHLIEQDGTDEQKEQLRKEREDREYRSHLKAAYVYIGEKRLMITVHNENMKAYKHKNDSYYEELVEPLEEQPYDKFDRWCTSMDM